MLHSRAEYTHFPVNTIIRVGDRILDLNTPRVMGIINCSPDSFYKGSRASNHEALLKRAEELILHGADILDIGGYSTRPDAPFVSQDEEMKRVKGVIGQLRKYFPNTLLSIDTFRASIAAQAIDEGVHFINDISGGTFDPELIPIVGQSSAAYILMHSNQNIDMLHATDSSNHIMPALMHYFSERYDQLKHHNVTDVIIDPGFGFGKTIDQNFEMLEKLSDLRLIGLPILIGISRKSMIYKTLNSTPEMALNGTTALHTIALLRGCSILRVHDPKEAKETIRLIEALFCA